MALDERGITLDEVKRRYPRTFQVLGYDALLDTDAMGKPKVISTFRMCINAILTLLMMKPGQYPSIPELGIDIESYLHEYSDDPSIPMEIKSKLEDQCNRLQLTGINIECFFDKTSDGVDALIVKVEGDEMLAYGEPGDTIIIGISVDKLNRLYIRQSYVN